MILSLVRSKPKYEIERAPSIGWCKRNMGFIIDKHQMNVALTRARLGLIVIGEHSTTRRTHSKYSNNKHDIFKQTRPSHFDIIDIS